MLHGGSEIDYRAFLEEVKRVVREAIEESKREDILKLGSAVMKIAEVLEGILGELRKHREILEEHSRILREHSKILEEHSRILEKHSKILEEHTRILREHSKSLARLEAGLGALGARLGVDLERTILNIYRDVLSHMGIETVKVEKISYKDIDGRYYRKGAKLELDIYVHDTEVEFIEVKSYADVGDVEWFQTRCEVFEKILGKKPSRRILVAVNISTEALERARELGIEVVYGRALEKE